MLTQVQKGIIEKYVDEVHFDRSKIIKYLEIHDIVGNEIFPYCAKKPVQDNSASYSRWLDNEYGYKPQPVNDFIRRIPFYFFICECSVGLVGDLDDLLSSAFQRDKHGNTVDELYQALEYMLYEKHLPIEDIFNYTVVQTNYVGKIDVYFQWKHYLQLCDELGRTDYMPDRFITSYNEVLEQSGLPSIIYEIEPMFSDMSWRTGSQIKFEGTFPCDQHGHPIMKWIGLRVKNAKSITCSQEKSARGRLYVEITPNTTIHALNCYNNNDDDDDFWYQIYAGPLTMEFDYEALKYNRKRLKYTQQEVADAIGATVRTYQKWENGDTIPDGHYLLRLLNWLDIRDVQDVVQYTK